MVCHWEEAEQRDNANKSCDQWKLGVGQGTKLCDMRDGTAQTLVVSEVLAYDSGKDPRGVWPIHVPGSSLFLAKTGPNSKLNDHLPVCEEPNSAAGTHT